MRVIRNYVYDIYTYRYIYICVCVLAIKLNINFDEKKFLLIFLWQWAHFPHIHFGTTFDSEKHKEQVEEPVVAPGGQLGHQSFF